MRRTRAKLRRQARVALLRLDRFQPQRRQHRGRLDAPVQHCSPGSISRSQLPAPMLTIAMSRASSFSHLRRMYCRKKSFELENPNGSNIGRR
jgi:hypothetical protein